MADVFISYRLKPSVALAVQLQEKLLARYNIQANTSVGLIVQEKLVHKRKIETYVESLHGPIVQVQLPESVIQAISKASVFVCLLGERTLESDWILEEIRCAYELGKPCIPVFQKGYTPPPRTSGAIDYLLNSRGVTAFDSYSILSDKALDQIAKRFVELTKRGLPTWASTLTFLVVIFLITALGVGYFGLAWLSSMNDQKVLSPTPVAYIALNTVTLTPDIEGIAQATVNAVFQRNQQTQNATATEQVRLQQMAEATIQSQVAVIQQTQAIIAINTRVAELQTTAITVTPVPSPTLTPTVTSTQAPTLSPVSLALQQAENFNRAVNNAWLPFEMDFDQVTMVLVPTGCFTMGNDQGEMDERPAHSVCFERPFWVDKFEVTQGQFALFGGQAENPSTFEGNDLPRETITWAEATQFCALRGGRLPSEAEWEYVARGVENWLYPWGNDWDAERVTSALNGNRQTSPVGMYPTGASWVGAEDMSGNVWEWTSSLYMSYPYAPEHEDPNNSTAQRVVRGGSFFYTSDHLRGDNRAQVPAESGDFNIGFRCVRPT